MAVTMRGRGVNYDTGFIEGVTSTRRSFDARTVRRELGVIAGELHCTAVRVSGSDLDRLVVAGEAALDAGLEVWFAPFPANLDRAELIRHLADAASRAEDLNAHSPGRVVLVLGCELSLFEDGFVPGDDLAERVGFMTGAWSSELMAAFRELPARLNSVLVEVVALARERFHGRITYASGSWEQIDWSPFDIVGVDFYRDAQNAATYRQQLRSYTAFGKPVAVTEFGCCTYRGAADRGGLGFMILDDEQLPPRLDGQYDRSEDEQVRYLDELLPIFEAEHVDSAFWFTFAGYELPHAADPLFDLDMASYGLVKLRPPDEEPAADGFGWERKRAFAALADAYGPGIDAT